GHDPTAVNDDIKFDLEGLGVDAARCEGPDRGSSPVRQEELVAVPARYDELLGSGIWQQKPHARRRLLDGQTLEIGASEREPDQAGTHVVDSANPHLAKPRWFT